MTLLEVALRLLAGKLSNPNSVWSVESYIPGCVRQAKQLMDEVKKVEGKENDVD